MTFYEDQSRFRKGHSPENFELLRRYAMNILRLDTSKESTQKKGKREARDENYLSPFDALLTCVYGFAEGTKSTKIS
jgi:hypothetical protein